MAYKTPQELGITELEHKYLAESVDILAEMLPNEFVLVPGDGEFVFYMNNILLDEGSTVEHGCKTSGCIKGLCLLLGHRDGTAVFEGQPFIDGALPRWADDGKHSSALDALFYPYDINYEDLLPKQASAVTKHFLETGAVDYSEVREYQGIEAGGYDDEDAVSEES